MEDLRIELNSPAGVYFPGSVVAGNVYIRSKETVKARSVVVSIVGKAKTHWTVWETHPSNRSQSQSVPYWSELIYLDQKACVWDSMDGNNKLPVGEIRFPFSFVLPVNIPPTFEGNIGFIRYLIKVKIDRPWRIDNVYKQAFTVTPHFDLNSVNYSGLPCVKQMSKNFDFLMFKNGCVDVKIMLAKAGYVPGESIALNVDIKNLSKKDLNRIEVSLIQSVMYTAKRHGHRYDFGVPFRHRETEQREQTRAVVHYCENFHVPKHSNTNYQRLLAIPAVVPSFNTCPIISVSYYLKIKLVASGLGNSITNEIPLLIGTIPVRPAVAAQTIEFPAQLSPPMPMPSAPPDYEESQISYGNCMFGRSTMNEDDEKVSADYTPKYIFYKNMS